MAQRERTGFSERLHEGIVPQAAHQNVDLSDRPVQDGFSNPGNLGGVVNVDDSRKMLGGRPAAQLFIDNLQDLKTEKDPVIDVSPQDVVQFGFDGELLDLRWSE